MTTKLITTSLRNNSSGKPTVQVNLRPNLVSELNLESTPHVELTRSASKYKLKFLSKQTARSRKLSFKESYATVGFPPEVFRLGNHKETVSSFPIDAEYIDDYLEFDFDATEFVKPRASATKTNKIATAEEKVAAGFKADTAWGVKVQAEMDERIERMTIESMKRKFMEFSGEVEKQGTVQTSFQSYSKIITGYASIKVGGANE